MVRITYIRLIQIYFSLLLDELRISSFVLQTSKLNLQKMYISLFLLQSCIFFKSFSPTAKQSKWWKNQLLVVYPLTSQQMSSIREPTLFKEMAPNWRLSLQMLVGSLSLSPPSEPEHKMGFKTPIPSTKTQKKKKKCNKKCNKKCLKIYTFWG